MRLSQGRDSWKASGVLRRDYRSTKDGPEITQPPRTKHSTPKVVCTLSPSQVHEPERFVTLVSKTPTTLQQRPFLRVRTHWRYRCRWCKTSNIAPQLLAPVADLVDAKTLQRLLACTWCKKGHLEYSAPLVLPSTSRRSSRYSRYFPPERWCLMCGHTSRYTPHLITDPALYVTAGVTPALADLLCRGARSNTTTTIYEPVLLPGPLGPAPGAPTV
jgi:hypothetical protein